ncbi:MAG: hypothetical protein HYX38_22690 [Rhodospirillales bacterium]|nr:hypothetical protein [Rhodospirillales bacterium]
MEIVALLVAAQLAQATVSPAARCRQLISFYDRYGVGRSNNSDGRRNHTRIGAEIDCERGDFQKGIAIMEDLLRNKAFSVPAPAQPETVPPLESPEYGV